jgi:catechol 2,3-dioxygenase-like lactoylglutathione lyase family enzyme
MTDARFAYTIIYVPDVPRAMAFYVRAFGLSGRFISDDGDYGELETGAVTLAFASESLGEANLPDGYQRHRPEQSPFGYEIAFATTDVAAAVQQSIAAGGALVVEPKVKPWGQTVAYVRDPNGVLFEICTPMGG